MDNLEEKNEYMPTRLEALVVYTEEDSTPTSVYNFRMFTDDAHESLLIAFGNYLLSEEREALIDSHPDLTDEGKVEAKRRVSGADLYNFSNKEKI